MKLQFLLISLFISALAIAQTKGTVTGIITDKDLQNETLPFANVVVKGTSVAVNTDIDGKYTFKIEPGNYTIEFSFLGYESVTKTVLVKANETTTLNLALGSGSYTLQDVVIQNNSNRAKETALLLDQKNAVEMKQAIGAQELSRKGVSDVANAVIKTTGITKQEGSGDIFVRGLGDRYNSTTMNGLPIPSNNPEKKNMSLEIFSTEIVEYISIDKVYSSKLFGDFAGGNIDINSKDYKGNGFFKIDIGSKINTNAVSEKDFSLQKGFNSFGFENRQIPSNALTQYKFSTLNLENKNPFAGSIGVSGGNSFNIGEQGKINFFATASFDNEYSAINEGSLKSGVNGSGVINKNFQKYTLLNYATSTTGMINLGYKINTSNKLNYNSLLINNSSQTKEEGTGYIVDIANDGNGLLRFSNYNKNTILINQLLGEHKLTAASKFNWGVAYNLVKADTPDRTQNTLRKEANGYVLSSISAPDNNRYYQYLVENELVGNGSVDFKFAKDVDDSYTGKITLGYSGRIKNSDFKATQFNFKANAAFANTLVDPNNLDSFYNQENFSNDYFVITTFRGNFQVPNALKPQTYVGDQIINGGYVNAEYKFHKLTTILGLRAEMIGQRIKWDTQLGGTGVNLLEKNTFLPSLVMKYELNDKQNLRLGFSKTYTLPQFKERAPFIFEKFGQAYIGNPYLYASNNYNLDLKWEMFPKNEELLSVTAYGKYIQNPMNEITLNSSTNDISYFNTGDYGYVIGGEIEYRKLLFDNDSKKLSAGLNASYLNTTQELNADKIRNENKGQEVVFNTNTDKFTGASDLLLNADISFFNEWNDKKSNLNTTLAYTFFSDRVNTIGTNGKGNLVDKSFGSLDLIIKSKINQHIGIGLVTKNILNPAINRIQENNTGDVNVLSYKKGLNLSLSLNYQF
ncbi:TonB-dependent receptor [Flavobacterium sp.]|uniref:TonB-dependent receptor n=1 Tax=Flavobacterium sp. TaxID=239 RepID=UPI002BAAA76E|nr:TonB-dependent receptor [Flavobacterium sp.]HQA73888.1 carboxypeptidase-like regulatory domain-containing protein [Flavobacterium sp.]